MNKRLKDYLQKIGIPIDIEETAKQLDAELPQKVKDLVFDAEVVEASKKQDTDIHGTTYFRP